MSHIAIYAPTPALFDELEVAAFQHGIVPRRLAALEEASRGLARIHRQELTRRLMARHRRRNGYGVDPLDKPEGCWAWRERLTLAQAATVRTSPAMELLVRAEQASRVLPGPGRNYLDEFISEIGNAVRFTAAEGSWRTSRGSYDRGDLPSLRAALEIVERWRAQAHTAMEARDHA